MLQLNNGNGTFSDIGQMAGVARTDWSWSALIADLDLDGNKDVYVTNGIAKDVTSQEYVAFLGNPRTFASATKGNRVDFKPLIDAMPSTKLTHYAFRNRGDLTFANESVNWGLSTPSFANGAAYGDLDGDGAVDLIINNVNDEAFIYRNNARSLLPQNHYLQLSLAGEGPNRFAIGAEITVRAGGKTMYQELQPTRGFQSSSDYIVNFGLGAVDTVRSVVVSWPDGRVSNLSQIPANRKIVIRQSEAKNGDRATPFSVNAGARLFTDVTNSTRLPFVHHENDYVDFEREPLMPRMLSMEGPSMAVADVNGDGLDDIFIGGAKSEPSAILVQRQDGSFARSNEALLAADSISEDVSGVFFDANGDHAPDLYVVTGGNEFSEEAPALQDRLYLNDGKGDLRKAPADALPPLNLSGSCVKAADFDGDGAIDLFVGGRSVPGSYGIDPQSVLLRNNGRGKFTNVTESAAPGLSHIGMVTDAVWKDIDGDGRPDLIVVGEWMPITVFHNAGHGRLEKLSPRGLEKSNGWWNRIIAADFTGDGRADFVVGNLGLNSRLQTRPNEPITMYVKDFAHNGFLQQIITYYNHGKQYPLTLRDDLLRAVAPLRDRYSSYKDYAKQTVYDVFPQKDLQDAVVKNAYTFATSLVRNNGDGTFTVEALAAEAQLAPEYGILAVNGDGARPPDLLMAGNFDGVKPEIGTMSAGYGVYLRNDGKGHFTAVRAMESGFFVPGQARDIQHVRTRNGSIYVVSRNNDRPLVFRAVRDHQ
jgi:hypothetical protein